MTTKKVENKKHYSGFEFSTEIPNIIDVQRQSFYSFIENGFKEAFQNSLCFSTMTHDLEILFFPEFIQFQKPDFNKNQAFVLGKTYGSSVYIPVGIKSKLSSSLKVEWLLIGVLPLMTKQGHFVINGIPRVVLHQMVRNPGIYTIPRDSRTQTATVRIVPEKGGWINLTIDKKNRIWFSTRTLRRKVSLLIFLQALGLSLGQIFLRLEHSKILSNSYVNDLSAPQKQEFVENLSLGKTRHDKILIRAGLEEHPATQEEAWRYLYAHFLEYSPYARDESLTDKAARDFFWNTLWNKETLILGKIGRQQFRDKVGSIEPLDQYSLTVEDILGATQALLKLIYKERLGDEIDSLTQKRIRGCNEFLLEQLVRGIKEFEIFFTRKINTLPVTKPGTPDHNPLEPLWRQNKAVFSKAVSKAWKSFFTSGTLAQFMDQTNPLAEATHKRRLTVLGPGGVNSKQTTIQIRGIHPTYYGRLCPIETPEGQNAGLVNSFTVLSTLSKDLAGTIKTPFYQVYKRQVQKTLPPLSVSPRQESSLIGAPADIGLTSWNLLPKTPLPVRKELIFDYDVSTRINTQSVGILQNISVATSLIPFLEHDDANRALMGSNMQRQAVPLANPQAPLVGTGLETRVVCDVNHGIQVSQSGYITQVTSMGIKIMIPRKPKSKKSRLSYVLKNTNEKTKETIFKNSEKKGTTVNAPKRKAGWNDFSIKEKRTDLLPFTKTSILKKRSLGGKKLFDLQTQVLKKGKKTALTPFFVRNEKRKLEVAKLSHCNFFSSKTSLYQEKSTFDLTFENRNVRVSINKKNLQNKQNFDYLLKLKNKKETSQNFFNPQKAQLPLDRTLSKKTVLVTKKKNIETFSPGFIPTSHQNLTNPKFKNYKTYNLTRYQRTNQSTCISQRPILSETMWVEKGDILADGAASTRGKLSIGQNVLVAYVPWEGYNFEDAILISQRLVHQDIFTSLHIDHYDIEVKNTQHGLERITNQIPLKIDESTRDLLKIEKLNSRGLVEIGSWVEEGDYLVGKTSPLNPKGPSVEHQYEKLYNVIMQREKTNFRNTSLRVPKGVEGFVLDVQILPSQEPDVAALAEKNDILRVRVVLLQRRRIQVGDKMAGRHGNKGIVSTILPRHDMPYLPDGTPIDIVLNPLGVPSRMNVGQILECLLGLAGKYLQESYTTNLFDEQFGAEASRSLVYSKLYEASIKSGNPWLFEPHHPGKIQLFDGRTGIPFDQPITIGCAYILKLVHLVDDKIHARATGPYSAVTQQPVRGRSRNGGQRLGEMEVWALQAYGAAYTLHELLTLKSDDVEGRKQAVVRIYGNKPLNSGRPESFKVLLRELQALCFDLQLYGIQKPSGVSGPMPLTKLENLL
uniref:DNA-directed RNA polymerase subunit beta n=1 Tax=Chlorella sp. ATCC 30562 TaxID=2025116 RepID=A0A2I4S6W9_9CHLO|nr:RNA polymerase beta subunit [Chlorella sp. ATCC 30562]